MSPLGHITYIEYPKHRPDPYTPDNEQEYIEVLAIARSSVKPKTANPIEDGEGLTGRLSLAAQVSSFRKFISERGQVFYNQGRADNARLPIRLTIIVMWGTVLQPGIPTNISEYLENAMQGKSFFVLLLFFTSLLTDLTHRSY